MRKLIVIFLLISSYCFSQSKTNSEKTWLIDYYFKSEKQLSENLSLIFDLTIAGKYNDAKTEIYQLKSTVQKSSLAYSALLCYEANICYNESKYDQSFTLANSAISITSNLDKDNRYIVKALNIKAKALSALNEFESSEKILNETVQLATAIEDKNGLASSYYLQNSNASDRGFYTKSKDLLLKSIALRKEIKDELGLAASYSFLGLTNAHLGDYMQGIEYIQQSITIREKNGDKRGLANSYLCLYKIYIDIGEADKALESELKSLDICKEINDLQCVSGRLTNLGKIYQNKGDYRKALSYHFMALAISKQINIRNRIAEVHENIAQNYNFTKKYDEAIKHIDSCITLRKIIGDEEGLVSATLVLSQISYNQNNVKAAIDNGTKALTASLKLKLPYLIKDAHHVLSNAYSQQHNADKSLFHFKQYIVLRDSLYNIDKTKEIVRKELEFNFNKKQELQKLEVAKKLAETDAESRKQQLIIIFSVIALIILSALLLFAIWQYRLKIKSGKQLQYLNSDLNLKNFQLEENSLLIETQHNTIHQKNKEITDSIRYAQKIQTAMMPLKHEFAAYFKDSFVLFEPKDIISGDFFWITSKNDKIIFATGDCTGHGVPGGFMSMLGVSLLNEIINEHDLTEPALILSRLRKKVITALRQKGLSGEQQDGMDMTICVIDKEQMTLQYAAANHAFYIIRKKESGFELEEFNGDKQPVGIFGSDLKPFKQYSIDLKPNDVVYTFTDGYADQFGGPKGKKFKYKQLKELLVSIQHLDLAAQEEIVKEQFTNWKGNLEQVDDVCLIGIRV
ncbi:MAG: SpoIIE family protein phosphatase [Bacteroidetes bacterium]|nr:SpoIIE family protein phosphatase [Bacteroidota bacterium]